MASAVAAIEQKLDQIEPGSERAELLESARQFKTNWVELGERLTRVLDGRLFEQWGYDSFDTYCTKELHLKRETAYKLVRSFTFVRTAKPEYLTAKADAPLPPMDVVDFLAKKREKEEMPPAQMQQFADQALDQGWTPRTVSAKWRDLVADEREAVVEDKGTKAMRRAREVAERLQKMLKEIPGVDPELIDAAQKIIDALVVE